MEPDELTFKYQYLNATIIVNTGVYRDNPDMFGTTNWNR